MIDIFDSLANSFLISLWTYRWYFGVVFLSAPVALAIVFIPLSIFSGRKVLDKEVGHDLVRYWFLNGIIALFLSTLLFSIVRLGISFEKINLIGHLPIPVQIIIFYFVIEFFAYSWHMLMHEVSFLEWIHSIHHEDYRLNYANGHKDTVFNFSMFMFVLYVSVAVLGVHLVTFVVALTLYEVFTALSHFGSDWKFKKFGYFFLSPHFHEEHHRSTLRKIAGESVVVGNFGGSLSFFDHVFRTVQWSPQKRKK
tara:strand:- start:1401 stop:2156 length:756 start_codon:yes stop_codon:yes gene_type:complete